MKLLKKRSKITHHIREFFFGEGFIEIETPLKIHSPAPELNIEPQECQSDFLITSPELQMKRILAENRNIEKIFQICKCFRKGECGNFHQPEFTMLEWYRKGAVLDDILNDCESLIGHIVKRIQAGTVINFNNVAIDLKSGWERREVADAFSRYAGWKPDKLADHKRFEEDLVNKVEPALPSGRPCFLVGFPSNMASLSKITSDNPDRCERFELYAGGLELANGFYELTDYDEQKKRFIEEMKSRKNAKKPVWSLDKKFLEALKKGLPNCCGTALGVDRLVMLLTNSSSISDVLAFDSDTI